MLSTGLARPRGGFAMRTTRGALSFLRRKQGGRRPGWRARPASSGARRRRWPWVLLGFGVLLFVLVGLGLLARPMMDVKPEADAARDELGMAQDALKAEDLDAAKVHVAAARAHVDEASTLVNGFGGDVWRWVPVGGGAIQDVRHLVGALDQATAIAEIGTEVYPELMQSDSLVQNAQVDLDQLDGILTSLNQAGLHLHAAVDDLEAVDGDTPFIGDKVLEARDQAWDRIEPISTTYDEAEPVLDALPDVLGAEGDRNYIVAIMNPAELRYSGGATLTLVPMTMSDGKIEFGDTVTNEDIAAGGDGKIKWPKVKGNPFHTPGKTGRDERDLLAVLVAVRRGAAARLGGQLRPEVRRRDHHRPAGAGPPDGPHRAGGGRASASSTPATW